MKSFETGHNTILVLSTYPPRECGIATFTQDLVAALNQRFNPITRSRVLALNENITTLYNYPSMVHDQVAANHLPNYVALAEKINKLKTIKLVNIQHEFGIFGGEWGDYLVPFLQVLKKPVVTTFHSVLPRPKEHTKHIVRFISGASKAIVVMNQRSRSILEKIYNVPLSKIRLIPHGIPNTSFDSSKEYKKKMGLEKNIVISTFGLLGPDKGIEYVLRALPGVIKKYPNLVYLVLGATHPIIRRREGEAYFNSLVKKVELLRLKNHVRFYHKYLTLEEIVNYLKATDIYISPSLNPNQSVSGTLSYALGCGRPAICTASEYSKYLIKPNTGIVVRPKKSSDLAKALYKLLGNPSLLQKMHESAYQATRHMIWPNVAGSYFNIFKHYANFSEEEKKLPALKLDHLIRMTDSFGMIQHAKYDKPNLQFGYSTDDNARALLFCAKLYGLAPQPSLLPLIKTYLKFLKYVQRPSGDFANIVSRNKHRDRSAEADVLGRSIWALGFTASQTNLPTEIQMLAKKMFEKSLRAKGKLRFARAIAFALIGLYFYLRRFPNKKLLLLFNQLANSQISFFRHASSPNWEWFEDNLTYSNSKLPESLLYAYELTKKRKYLTVACTSLNFLTKVTFQRNHYIPIGQRGWYVKNKQRSYFDQQPEDIASMVQTKMLAYKITKERKQLRDAFIAFQWFLGKNHLKQMVYNEASGGCHDGLGEYSLNLNQGAESTLSYLLARLEFEE